MFAVVPFDLLLNVEMLEQKFCIQMQIIFSEEKGRRGLSKL